MKQKKWAVAGVTAGLLAGAGASFALNVPGGAGASPSRIVVTAANDNSTVAGAATSTRHGDPAERAAKLNEVLQPLVDAGTITSADRTAILNALTTRPTTPPAEGVARGPQAKLAALVTAGTITQAKADAVAAALEAARPAEGAEGRPHGGPGDRGGRGGHGDHDRGPRAEGLAKAADVIGISVDALKTALMNGQTIAQVAQANGKSVDSVIDALVADATANLRQRITDMVNGVEHTESSAPAGS